MSWRGPAAPPSSSSRALRSRDSPPWTVSASSLHLVRTRHWPCTKRFIPTASGKSSQWPEADTVTKLISQKRKMRLTQARRLPRVPQPGRGGAGVRTLLCLALKPGLLTSKPANLTLPWGRFPRHVGEVAFPLTGGAAVGWENASGLRGAGDQEVESKGWAVQVTPSADWHQRGEVLGRRIVRRKGSLTLEPRGDGKRLLGCSKHLSLGVFLRRMSSAAWVYIWKNPDGSLPWLGTD